MNHPKVPKFESAIRRWKNHVLRLYLELFDFANVFHESKLIQGTRYQISIAFIEQCHEKTCSFAYGKTKGQKVQLISAFVFAT